ncbi:hypothetical protein E4U53_002233 [Claviceps sorghi]|nr:hypothetical protein E4U53_002233 [Claviceps sorghi]
MYGTVAVSRKTTSARLLHIVKWDAVFEIDDTIGSVKLLATRPGTSLPFLFSQKWDWYPTAALEPRIDLPRWQTLVRRTQRPATPDGNLEDEPGRPTCQYVISQDSGATPALRSRHHGPYAAHRKAQEEAKTTVPKSTKEVTRGPPSFETPMWLNSIVFLLRSRPGMSRYSSIVAVVASSFPVVADDAPGYGRAISTWPPDSDSRPARCRLLIVKFSRTARALAVGSLRSAAPRKPTTRNSVRKVLIAYVYDQYVHPVLSHHLRSSHSTSAETEMPPATNRDLNVRPEEDCYSIPSLDEVWQSW